MPLSREPVWHRLPAGDFTGPGAPGPAPHSPRMYESDSLERNGYFMDTQRERWVRAIKRERVSAIIRTKDQALAAEAMQAAVDGGFKLIEFTLTTPGALELVKEFSQRDGLLVGAGTVLTTNQAREAVEAGARFLVSPIVDAEVIGEAAALDVPCIPGAYTPTEMETAYRYGADFIKVFPAPFGGAEFIRGVLGPLPHLNLFPTAGATPDNFGEFLEAGCAGVGFVRSLFVPSDLSTGDFTAIRDRAARIVMRLSEFQEKG